MLMPTTAAFSVTFRAAAYLDHPGGLWVPPNPDGDMDFDGMGKQIEVGK